MKILILGATGRTGKLLLQEALQQGYEVNVLVRNRSRVPLHPALTVFEGSPADTNILNNAMKGCEAILSALNISRNSDFPWAALRTPPDFLSKIVALIIELAPQNNIARIIVISAWGTSDTRNDIPWWFKWVIEHSNVGVAYRDHERQEGLFAASALNYTIVRPAGLVNSIQSKPVIISLNNMPKPRLTISRGEVVKFMVQVLQDDLFLRQMPVVST
ncbi:NAD(P)-dependent oxidoreductase [Mucilaginibacter gilvus]|uniref:NAD-dependent epimerase/dehydratase family protein n=1 Tax=Mucilaginibacter gilvus TaxID=2305909 RepID=A0A444MQ23_9SPHI|nr:NAD(P)H-binding protein [Mucilaginibacter gilvus]RWY53687.1 NAD-dependent epimerase/dehydratase family protein [Mucilaginibacter gilvus]